MTSAVPTIDMVADLLDDVDWHPLGCAPWADDYPSTTQATFALAHCGTHLLIGWRVSEDCLRAEALDGGHVWEDSCCELFIELPSTDHYYNIECNCTGHLLVAAGQGRADRQPAPREVLKAIGRRSSLGNSPFSLVEGHHDWHMELLVPLTTFFCDRVETFSGLHARANAYKCGDKTAAPHFLSLAPIDAPHPDFHRPEFFVPLIFEE